MEKQRILLLLLVTLNVADLITTIYGLSLGASELNPLFPEMPFTSKESLITKIGLPFLYSGLFLITSWLYKKERFLKGLQLLKINLLVLVGVYLIVVTNNLLGIILALRN